MLDNLSNVQKFTIEELQDLAAHYLNDSEQNAIMAQILLYIIELKLTVDKLTAMQPDRDF